MHVMKYRLKHFNYLLKFAHMFFSFFKVVNLMLASWTGGIILGNICFLTLDLH